MTENLYYFVLATFSLAITPGPDNIYVLSQSLSHGYKFGIATTAGLISGCIVHTTLLAFGMSAVIAASPTIFFYYKSLGSTVLVVFGFSSLSGRNCYNFWWLGAEEDLFSTILAGGNYEFSKS